MANVLPDKAVSDEEISTLCRDMLSKWCVKAGEHIYTIPDTDSMEVYGIGHNSWGVQTTQKALAAFATIGMHDKNEQFVKRALNLLRFNMQSHIEGEMHCLDGTKWGHTWIGTLGINRMMHGVLLIWDRLSDPDKALFEKMMVSESEYLCTDYVIKAGKEAQSGKNAPESNIWNGAHLLTTACMFPEKERNLRYLDRAADFFINGISVDCDAYDHDLIYGKPISQRYVGSNFFDTYSLNHHGYMNIGYMVICLSNVAMTHFLLKSLGVPVPDYVYRHVSELWNLVKHFIFPDGRLNRIGGDTRVRYCYCQDYLVPVLLMLCDLYKDPTAKKYLIEWLKQVKTEFDYNNDGSFLSCRASDLTTISPLYYTRLESDRSVVLSMALQYSYVTDDIESIKTVPADIFSWHDPFHGSTFVKGENSYASFTWIAGERPQGMCLPVDAGDCAEWKENLCGSVAGLGKRNIRDVLWHETSLFDNGFVTFGCSKTVSYDLPEGSPKSEEIAEIFNFYIALPDNSVCVAVQFARSIHRKYIKNVKGTLLKIPNDIFNGNCRTYRYGNTCHKADYRGVQDEIINTQSKFINIDQKISLISLNSDITVLRPSKRQVAIHYSHFDNGFLYCDELCTQFDPHIRAYSNGEVIIDTGAIIISGVDAGETLKYYDKYTPIFNIIGNGIRKITVHDIKGNRYDIYINNSNNSVVLENELSIPAYTAIIFGDFSVGYASVKSITLGRQNIKL